jgi:GBP family porin
MTRKNKHRGLSLLASATLLAAAQVGAQTTPASSVTLYGVADACVVSYKGAVGSTLQVNGGGCTYGSRFGLRGSEDLGDGMRAYFQLESGVNLDSGAIVQTGRLFGRKAIVGLGGAWGAVEAGREYAPGFYLLTAIDPMQLGIGSATATLWAGSPGTASGRTDNSVSYQTPSLGGFTARVLFAPGEQAAPLPSRGGDTVGANIMYRSTELIAGVSYAKVSNVANSGDDSATTVAAKYDFGKFSLAAAGQFGGWEGTRSAAAPANATSMFSRRYNSYVVGGTLKLGANSLSATYKRYDDRTRANYDADIWSLIYTHPLSKRTNLYSGVTRLKNKGASSYGAADGNGNYTGTAIGGSSRAIDFGMVHFF